MKTYQLSDRRARLIDELVADGVFRNPREALNEAVDNYLGGFRQRPIQSGFAIDHYPADSGVYGTQELWISFFNVQGRPMISAADVYGAGKSASDKVLQSLRRDFDESWLVSSTRISYSGDDLSGIVTQNYGSSIVKPSQISVSVIPVYNGTPLAQALQTKEGIDYLQAVFDVNDDPGTIRGTLEHLSERDADNIVLWTPDQGSRKRYSKRAVGFVVDVGEFHVKFDGGLDDDFGLSRGVSVSPRSGRAKK